MVYLRCSWHREWNATNWIPSDKRSGNSECGGHASVENPQIGGRQFRFPCWKTTQGSTWTIHWQGEDAHKNWQRFYCKL